MSDFNVPIDIHGYNKQGKPATIVAGYGYNLPSGNGINFSLRREVWLWLKENIGHGNYSLPLYAIETNSGLLATIYFKCKEDAVLFKLIWG